MTLANLFHCKVTAFGCGSTVKNNLGNCTAILCNTKSSPGLWAYDSISFKIFLRLEYFDSLLGDRTEDSIDM